jgi:hypothetical protein
MLTNTNITPSINPKRPILSKQTIPIERFFDFFLLRKKIYIYIYIKILHGGASWSAVDPNDKGRLVSLGLVFVREIPVKKGGLVDRVHPDHPGIVLEGDGEAGEGGDVVGGPGGRGRRVGAYPGVQG